MLGREGVGRGPIANDDDRAATAAGRYEPALWVHREFRGQSGVCSIRPAAPEHDQIGPVLDLAERAGDRAEVGEQRPSGGTAKIDAGPDAVREGDGRPLGAAGEVSQTVDEWVTGGGQNCRG